MDWFVSLIEKLFPPMSAIQTWRTLMAILVMALCLQAAAAMGWVPGMHGYAQIQQVAELKEKIEANAAGYKSSIDKIESTQNVILARILASDIETARSLQCKSIAERNTSAVQGWRVRLDASMYEYRTVSGREYTLRPCDEY
jgi:hypothetical protein